MIVLRLLIYCLFLLQVEKVLQQNNRSITFLAPTDETFALLEDKDLKMLKENKEKAEEILRNHVLTGKLFLYYLEYILIIIFYYTNVNLSYIGIFNHF